MGMHVQDVLAVCRSNILYNMVESDQKRIPPPYSPPSIPPSPAVIVTAVSRYPHLLVVRVRGGHRGFDRQGVGSGEGMRYEYFVVLLLCCAVLCRTALYYMYAGMPRAAPSVSIAVLLRLFCSSCCCCCCCFWCCYCCG